MPSLRQLIWFALTCTFVASVDAAPAPATVKTEIDGLMSRLEASGCRFHRNGSWHSAMDAKAHLLRKLKYLEGRGAVQTTEQFIERGATGSSTTGQPYQVSCGNGAAVPSATWLLSQLQSMRSAGTVRSVP